MANWDDPGLIKHISAWEGGLSSDPRDTCAKKPSSIINPKDGNPYHTNRGVCFMTWESQAKKLGYDSTSKGFINMTKDQWRGIIKNGFWQPLFLDPLRSQKIAELLLETHWGSGMGGVKPLYRYMQSQVGLTDKDVDGVPGMNTTNAVNKYIKTKAREDALYQKMWDFRMNWLRKLGENPKYTWALRGWTNRMNALYERSKNLVTTYPKTFLGLFLALGVGIFFLVRKK